MYAKTTLWIAVSAALLMSAGCGRNEDYRERFIKLQEQSREDLARMEAMYKAQTEGYKQKLASREKELRVIGGELAEAKRRFAENKIRPAISALSTREREQKKAKVTAVQPGARSGGSTESVSAESPVIPKDISFLEKFALEYENSVEEGRREQYQKDFGSFLAALRAQAQEPAQRTKEKMIGSLRERINAETDAEDKELIENRLAKIENASPEDLEGTLNYYQQIDSNQELNRLMDEYNISRDELRDYGITPPPRVRWGPDVKEIANNLNSFVENYEPLVPQEQRDQYRKDFNDLITDFSTRPSDAQVLQRKNQMMADLQAQYAAAPEAQKQRIQRRMQGLEATDLDSLRRRVQMEKAREIREISERYGIPRTELQESGIRVPRARPAR